MKKLFISLLAVLALSTAASAQNNALGVRLGYGAALGTELSFQHYLSDITRLELDLGVRFAKKSVIDKGDDAMKVTYPGGPTLTTAYQWHWFLAGGFGFFFGPAVQLSMPYWHHFGMGLGGQIGFDYQLDAPFQIGFDFRPIYNVIGKFKGITEEGKTRLGGGFDPSFALSLRYAF